MGNLARTSSSSLRQSADAKLSTAQHSTTWQHSPDRKSEQSAWCVRQTCPNDLARTTFPVTVPRLWVCVAVSHTKSACTNLCLTQQCRATASKAKRKQQIPDGELSWQSAKNMGKHPPRAALLCARSTVYVALDCKTNQLPRVHITPQQQRVRRTLANSKQWLLCQLKDTRGGATACSWAGVLST